MCVGIAGCALTVGCQGLTPGQELDLLDSLLIDAVAMQEAVWCIIRNALEATPQGGRIKIAVRRSSEETVEIVIRDTGPGLSRDALGQCFDPFFSGREAGRGLGLGLAKAERIAVLHGGSLSLRNIESGGCEARFLIPG